MSPEAFYLWNTSGRPWRSMETANMQGSFISIAAGVCPPFKPAILPLAVPAPNRFSTLKKKAKGPNPPMSSSAIFQCHGLWRTPSFRRKKIRASGVCKMLFKAPWHGKMTSASTAGRSRCNQPSLRSYIDCYTTANWTLDVCHLRAYKESTALAEIVPHTGRAKRIQASGLYQK